MHYIWKFRLLRLGLAALVMLWSGCKSAEQFRHEADRSAYTIIKKKRQEGLGKNEPFTIERPADTLRRRLLLDQNLPHLGPASRSVGDLDPIDHWPKDNYLKQNNAQQNPLVLVPDNGPLLISLNQSLQIAARNSGEYQNEKEDLYRAALDLDLERDRFRLTFTSLTDNLVSADHPVDDQTRTGIEHSSSVSLTKKLKSGITLTSLIVFDLVKLLSEGPSSIALAQDSSIQIPLLRGSGRHVATESLTQAERDMLYAVYGFERFKRIFSVQIARDYLDLLGQIDAVENTERNYRNLILAKQRARRMADAGKLDEIQVDQAIQNELQARKQWIESQQARDRLFDLFKLTLGLPTDASITVDREELQQLVAAVVHNLPEDAKRATSTDELGVVTDAFMHPHSPHQDHAGPLAMEPAIALDLALTHRLDLRVVKGQVYDAQRGVVMAADALGAELTLLGSASIGEGRTIDSASDPDGMGLKFDRGRYDALLSLDLPLERTAERNLYRMSLVALEQAVRNLQELEDQIKVDVRNNLRELRVSHETLKIEHRAVKTAERRVSSANLFLQAGRIKIRDLLEAQEDLLLAQNDLTEALVGYRVAELQLQRDMGVLEIDETGLFHEFLPHKPTHGDP